MADEPLFMAIDENSSAYRETIQKAQSTLSEFLMRFALSQATGAIPCLKVKIVDGDEVAFVWLMNARPDEGGFVAEVFQIPPEFTKIRVGDEISVRPNELLDWMIIEDGVLHGGFSLRHQRSLLPEGRRAWYDEYIGVKKYA